MRLSALAPTHGLETSVSPTPCVFAFYRRRKSPPLVAITLQLAGTAARPSSKTVLEFGETPPGGAEDFSAAPIGQSPNFERASAAAVYRNSQQCETEPVSMKRVGDLGYTA